MGKVRGWVELVNRYFGMMQKGKIIAILKLSCLFLDIYFSKKKLMNSMIMPLS